MPPLRIAAALLAIFFLAPAAADAAPGWSSSGGAMNAARFGAAAVTLNNGQILVEGGVSQAGAAAVKTAELFDPTTGKWTATGSMGTARVFQTATLLANGKVLVAGGESTDVSGTSTASAEIFDPAGSGSWSSTGPMGTARALHTATLLPNGKVLVTGGETNVGSTTTDQKTTELYDPASGTFSGAQPMSVVRADHFATLLPNGTVLVGGGSVVGAIQPSAETYDPAGNAWTPAGGLNVARGFATATLLSTGKVLLAGGFTSGGLTKSAEVYDPATRLFSNTGDMTTTRGRAAAALMPGDRVLVTGGFSGGAITGAELWSPVSNVWTAVQPMATARQQHFAVPLGGGKVLAAGGSASTTSEVYSPGTTSSSPAVVAFGDQTLATAAAPTPVLITNSGELPLTVTNVTIGGANASDFGITNDGCTGLTTAAGNSCTVNVRFTPGALGTRSATLSYSANTTAASNSSLLSGRGVAAATPTPTPTATPTAVATAAATAPPTPVPTAVPTPAPTAKVQLTGNVFFVYRSTKKSTKFSSLSVKGLVKGSTVTVKCPKGCAKKSFSKKNLPGTSVSIASVVGHKALKVGATLSVTITKPGASGITKTLKIRARKAPTVTTKLGAV